jgi:hypothetical protein
MDENEVSELIEQLRREMQEQIDIACDALEETIDNMRGRIDALERRQEAAHEQ